MFIDRIVYYDHNSSKWICDEDKLTDYEISANVIEFMSNALSGTTKLAHRVLVYIACMGRKTTAFDLSELLNIEIEVLETALNELIQNGLVSKSVQGMYGFNHDKVQEAVYESVESTFKQEIHARIAQVLLQKYQGIAEEELLFDIISHLERSADAKAKLQIENLSELYFRAGVKALEASANHRAFVYLKEAVIFHKNDWDTDYTKALLLHDKAAEAAYLAGEFEYLEQISDVVYLKAKLVEDKANVYGLNIQSCMSQNKHLEGVERALKIIDEFGVSIPLQPTMEDAGQAFQTVGGLLTELKNVSELLNRPELEDRNLQSVMRILADIVPIAFNAAPGHLPLVVCKMVEISIVNGNSKHSPFAYSLYALLLCGIIGDIKLGTTFGDLAIDLVNKRGTTSEMAKTYNMVGLHVMHFKDHLEKVTRTLEMAYLKGLETGDHLFAGFAGHGYCLNYYLSGNELNRTRKVFENYTHSMENIKQGTQTTFQKRIQSSHC